MFNGIKAKKLIKEAGRTRKWAAKQAGIQTETLTDYLNGPKRPSKDVATRLATALEVPETELWTKPDEKKAS